MASHATINKSFEDKLAKLSSQLNNDRNRSRGKQVEGGEQRSSSVVCSYCNRPRHSAENCYKKQNVEQRASRPPATVLGSSRTPSVYLDEGAEHETKGIRYESAFIAIAQDTPVPFYSQSSHFCQR